MGAFDDLRDRELERARKAWEAAGNIAAVWEAVALCQADTPLSTSAAPRPLPEWLYGALGEIMAQYLAGEPTGKRWAKRWKQDMKELERYEAVEECRDPDRQATWKDERAHFGSMQGSAARRAARELGELVESTKFEIYGDGSPVFQKAAELLKRRGVEERKAGTLRDSWRRVGRLQRTDPWRYYSGTALRPG